MKWTVLLVRGRHLENATSLESDPENDHNVKRELILHRLDGFLKSDGSAYENNNPKSMTYQLRKAKHQLWVDDVKRYKEDNTAFRRCPNPDDYETVTHQRGHPPIVRYNLNEDTE